MKPAIVEEERSRGCFKKGQKEKRPLGLGVRTCAHTHDSLGAKMSAGCFQTPKNQIIEFYKQIIKCHKTNYQTPKKK